MRGVKLSQKSGPQQARSGEVTGLKREMRDPATPPLRNYRLPPGVDVADLPMKRAAGLRVNPAGKQATR
jgi:hypothetical protein